MCYIRIMQEEWKEISGWNGVYYISSCGRVRKGNKFISVTPNKKRHGYRYVNLSIGAKRKNTLVHRLVALHFIPNPSIKPCVNHIDFDVSNNSVGNLEWATHKENSEHTVRAGRSARLFGEAGANVKLSLNTVRNIRCDLLSGMSNTAIAKKHGTNYSNVAHIKRGSRWGKVV